MEWKMISTLTSCCCGCSLRSGTILSAIYTLVLSVLNCCLALYSLLSLKTLRSFTEADSDIFNYHVQVTSGWLYTVITLSSVLLVASLLLLVGVLKDIKQLLLPWMVVLVLTVLLDVAVLIYDCAVFGMLSFNLVQMFLWFLSTLLNIYCLLCVWSQYRNISVGTRNQLNNMEQSQGLILYSTTIQHVHLSPGPLYIRCPDPSATVVTTLLTNTGHPVDKPCSENLTFAQTTVNNTCLHHVSEDKKCGL